MVLHRYMPFGLWLTLRKTDMQGAHRCLISSARGTYTRRTSMSPPAGGSDTDSGIPHQSQALAGRWTRQVDCSGIAVLRDADAPMGAFSPRLFSGGRPSGTLVTRHGNVNFAGHRCPVAGQAGADSKPTADRPLEFSESVPHDRRASA